MNIKFNYLYRDRGNYKVFGSVVFSNPKQLNSKEIETALRKVLIDSEFFNPDKLGIPRLKHTNFPYDHILDHSLNEFHSVEETNETASYEIEITDFLKALENS